MPTKPPPIPPPMPAPIPRVPAAVTTLEEVAVAGEVVPAAVVAMRAVAPY